MSAEARGTEPTSSELEMLARVLESFTETLDLEEVLGRAVRIALEEFGADRAWIIAPVDPAAASAAISYEATADGWEGALQQGIPIPLAAFRGFIDRAIAAREPIEGTLEDPDIDRDFFERFSVRTQLVQILQTRDGQFWAFGLHQCRSARHWSEHEKHLFSTIGRYATLAMDNALLHRKSVMEAATVNAILDQVPEAAAIFGPGGQLIQMNAIAAAQREHLFGLQARERLSVHHHRDLEGRPLEIEELPSMRALRGEHVVGDYQLRDPQSGEDRIVHFRAAPVRDEGGEIIGSIVLSRDVTEERSMAEKERWRRRRAETLGGLSFDLVTLSADFSNLDEVARHIGEGLQARIGIYVYRASSDTLELAGSHTISDGTRSLADYLGRHPFKAGEGLPGTVFQIGQPLFFADAKEGGLQGYARNDEEQKRIDEAGEQSLVACPIEAYGERVGALIMAHVDPRRAFQAEDLAFAQAAAERIAAAYHIYRLNRLSAEGHRAAEELARREVSARARLEAVLESAPTGIAVVSADELRFEIVNWAAKAYAERFGKVTAETDLTGLRVDEVIPHLESVLAEAAEKNQIRVDRAIPTRFQDQTGYHDRIVSPVRGRFSGITQSLTLLIQDVTESVRSKQEIDALVRMMEERTARLDSILGSMTDALWVLDAEGNVIDVNRAALSMFGLGSQSDAIARASFEDFKLRFPDGRPIPWDELPYSRAIRGEIVPDFVAVGAHLITGADIDLSIAAAPIRSGGSVVGAVLVIRDISALQELDRKKDEFLSVASHELRTPLTTIRGYAQLLTQLIFEIGPEERATYLRSMLSEIDRMMGLITELLDVSRIQRNRLQVDPQEMEWIGFVRSLIEGMSMQREILFESGMRQVKVHADPQRMRQVIDNLLSNAIKYSPDDAPVRIRVEEEQGVVSTFVSDRGIGIPVDELPHLFERFHRARNVSSRYYGGLGLGLYISRAIVEAHGGTISVQTTEGEGSTFRVDLPAGPGAMAMV